MKDIKVIIKDGEDTRDLYFRWNGTDFGMISKAFNPCFEQVIITPYDMQIKGITKTRMQVPIYGKNVNKVQMIIDIAT